MSIVPHNLRQAPPPDAALPAAMDVSIDADGADAVQVDPKTGATTIATDDGGVIIDFAPNAGKNAAGSKDHDANLAEYIDPGELGRIGNELITGIQADDDSRKEWLDMRAQGIRLLGLSLGTPRSDVSGSAATTEGMSTIQHPMLLEATLRFQANARGELLPSSGPVKISNELDQSTLEDDAAEALEHEFNYNLTTVDRGYVPDTDRMLFYTGFGGCGFKKVYNCPVRRRPVSESVDAKDLIVSDASTDMVNAARVTQVIMMRPSILKRMQIVGAYRDVPLSQTGYQSPDVVTQEVADLQGTRAVPQQPQDQSFIIYECYCELDIAGFEHKEKGKTTGLPLPYRVVIEKESQQILEVRRNWREDDELMLARRPFVKFPFVPGLGFYDIGLVHILGNTTNAITAAWREMLDAGMFANFPGFLYAKIAGRQLTNEFRVPPGGGVPIDTNGGDIRSAIMPLPYKDISTAFAGFVDNIAQTGQRLGGTAEISIGEGKQDAPVGTTLALIEQATKIEDAVHKRLHAAQAEEFQMLKECFRDDPDSFLRSVRKKGNIEWNEQMFLAALEDADLVPQADPNTPSHMHRLMKATAVKQLAVASPQLYDMRAVDKRVLSMIGIGDAESLFAKPTAVAPPPPDPKVVAAQINAQSKLENNAQDAANHQSELQLKTAIAERESADDAANRASKEKIAQMNMARDLIIHKDQQATANAGILGQSQPPANLPPDLPPTIGQP